MKAKKSAPTRIMGSTRRHSVFHGGSWKVAYADFVTAMMAFFLLMWILGIVPKDVQRALETYFKNPTLGAVVPDANTPIVGQKDIKAAQLTEEQAARYTIAMRLKKVITDDPFLKSSTGVSSDDAGVLLRVNNDAMFKPGSAELTPQAHQIIQEVQGVLKSYNLYLMVRGHAQQNESKGGPYPSNWELSGARATAVVRAVLADKALTPNRLRALAYADTRPLVPDLSPDSATLNRRVEFYFHRPEVMNFQVVQ